MPMPMVRSAKMFVKAAMLVASVAGTAFSAEPMVSGEGAERIAGLIDSGQVIEAREEAVSLMRVVGEGEARLKLVDLLAEADRKIEALDDLEVSAQKAEYAFKVGDLRGADRQAAAILRSDKASQAQKQAASDLMDRGARLRSELAPAAHATLEQSLRDMKSGNYAQAKAGIASVSRLGLKLDQTQQALLNRAHHQILDLEQKNGRPFDSAPIGFAALARQDGFGTPVDSGGTRPPLPNAPQTPVPVKPRTPEPQPAPMMEQPAPAEPMMEAPAQPVATEPSYTPPPASEMPAPMAASDNLFDQSATFDAQRMLREADAAFEAGRYSEALEKYGKCAGEYSKYLRADEVNRAADRRRESQVRLGGFGAAGGDLAQQELRVRQIMREEAEAVVANQIKTAQDALAAGNPEAARTAAATARLKWNEANANGLLSAEQFKAKMNEIDALVRQVDTSAEEIRARASAEQSEKLKADKMTQEQRARAERESRINESLDRLRALQAEQKYEEAIEVVDEVLFLDPTNPAAMLMRDILKDTVQYRTYDRLQREKNYGYSDELLEIQKAMVIPQELMSFPPDWPEISLRRGDVQSYTESPVDRKVMATLDTRKIPVKFQDNSLADVLSFIATVTNVNMDVDWDQLTEIGVEKDTKVTLELREVTARTVLDRVLQKASKDEFSRASWAVQDGVVIVSSQAALQKNKFIVIYDVRDLLFQIPNYNVVPDLDLNSVLSQGGSAGGGGGGGGGGGSSLFGGGGGAGAGGDPRTPEQIENEQLTLLLEIIQNNVDFNGWRDNGGDTGVVQNLNGNLIITNTARNHREIQGLLNQLREVRNLQINVQTQFLVVSQAFFEQIGFDLDIYFNANNNQYKSAKGQQRFFGVDSFGEGVSVLPSDLVGTSDRTNTTTNYNVSAVDDDGTITYQFSDTPFSVVTPNDWSVIPVQNGSDALAQTILGGSQFAQDVLSVNPALGIAGQFLDDIQVDFLVTATQADRRSVALTAPRLTMTNGRTANIYVANQVAFVSDLTPVVGTSAVAFDPTLSTISEGFTLLVRGVVSADRRYVTTDIQARISQLQRPFRSVRISSVAAGGGDGAGAPITSDSAVELPTATVTSVSTGVTIPDQGTLLLGGQRVGSEVEVETGVPVLSKIPIINRFFTNRIETREDQTLVVLLKPTILIQKEEEETAFPGLSDSLKNPFGN
ncbi:MAG: hypothetical protein ACKVZJ_02535 [Phycisphaerales bacterium]